MPPNTFDEVSPMIPTSRHLTRVYLKAWFVFLFFQTKLSRWSRPLPYYCSLYRRIILYTRILDLYHIYGSLYVLITCFNHPRILEYKQDFFLLIAKLALLESVHGPPTSSTISGILSTGLARVSLVATFTSSPSLWTRPPSPCSSSRHHMLINLSQTENTTPLLRATPPSS